MNKRWKYNKDTNKHELYFTQFYYEELIATLWTDGNTDYYYSFKNRDYLEDFCLFYSFKNRDHSEDFDLFNSLEQAKNYIENRYVEIIQDQIDYLKDKLEKLK